MKYPGSEQALMHQRRKGLLNPLSACGKNRVRKLQQSARLHRTIGLQCVSKPGSRPEFGSQEAENHICPSGEILDEAVPCFAIARSNVLHLLDIAIMRGVQKGRSPIGVKRCCCNI